VSNWHDRKGAIDEDAVKEILQDIDAKVTYTDVPIIYIL